MKKSYVAFFPPIDQTHWISDFRRQHDPKSHVVQPHVTLVFPTDLVTAHELGKEIERFVKDHTKFKVRFRSALLMPDDKNSGSIFLVPDEGFSDVLRLHDLLYSEKLKTALRLDIPFIPHLTIGSGLELEKAKAKVDKLNAKAFDVEFLLNQLTIVEIPDPLKDRVLVKSIELK